MKIIHYQDVAAEPVALPGAQGCRYRVLVSACDGAPNFAMRLFEVEPAGHTPLHEHPYEHEIYVLDGLGTVWHDGREIPLRAGDVLYIPAGEKHQFRNTGTELLRFLCLIPAQFQKC